MDEILRRPAVQRVTGKSRSEIYDDIAKKQFPRPVPLSPGGHSVGWLKSEVDRWLAARVVERDTCTAKRGVFGRDKRIKRAAELCETIPPSITSPLHRITNGGQGDDAP